jgi:hypothetical protein
MDWKKELKTLENAKEWDFAIELMKDVIQKNPNDMKAYIFMNFLLMNLLVEEEYDREKHDYYAGLLKKYFQESYKKFSNNAAYLYYTGITGVMADWYFGITTKEREAMIEQGISLDPENPAYKFHYYADLLEKDPTNAEALEYAKMYLSDDSPVKKIHKEWGSLGEYILEIHGNWCKMMLDKRNS